MNGSLRCKGRSRPIVPDAQSIKAIAFKLEEAIAMENISKSNVFLTRVERKSWEVTLEDRDRYVNTLRFLKFWFDVPQTVYFTAVHFLDQFLTRMKVQQKYMACICVSCFYVAATSHDISIDANKLVAISQSNCSVKDMNRMCDIIEEKLNLKANNSLVTSLEFLTSFLVILDSISIQVGAESLMKNMLPHETLKVQLEVLVADSSCASYKPSTLTLALIQSEMERFLTMENPKKSAYYTMEMLHMLTVILELQHMCKIRTAEFAECYAKVWKTLEEYDTHEKSVHNQKLLWQFSSSTLMSANCRKYYPTLETILER